MSTQSPDPQKATVYGRLFYPSLFKTSTNKKVANAKPKFGVNIGMDPKTPEGKASIAACNAAIEAAGKAQWKKWPHPNLIDTENGEPLDKKRFCLVKGSTFRDKDGNPLPEMKGLMILKCSSAEDKPPVLVDADGRTPLKASDNKLYPGCYGRVGVRIYGTENGGLGVFAALNAAQFKKHGEPLGGGAPARAEDYFEAEEVTDDEDDDLV